MKKIIIAAIAQNGIIGSDSFLPWKLKEEMDHFKETTIGFPVIIGRKTFESLRKPLKDRLNIVISSKFNKKDQSNNVIYFPSISSAYHFLRTRNYKTVFIAGGESIYQSTINHANEMILSFLKFEVKGDKLFPKINFKNWILINETIYEEFIVKHFARRK